MLDFALDFNMQVTDGDGNQIMSNTFIIGIDGAGFHGESSVIWVNLLV